MAIVASPDFDRFKEGARRFASGFTRGQKAVTIAAAIGVLIVAVTFMSLSGKPSYSVLFTNLQPSDAASITQTLATNHVPYQLQDGGTTILVPQNDVDQQRLAAAQAGLPSSSSSGLSILDKEGLTTSQLTQQADYLRAIQSELEQTVDSINGVTSSVITVAESANQTFALGNTNPTGASVLVNLKPGATLTYNQVAAISSLVASSVPGLTSANVTVADSSGDLLAGPGVSDSGQATSAAAAYDSATEAQVVSYLAGVLGPNNADVQVNAQLNFNQVKTNTQTLITGTNGKPQTACTNTQTSNTKYTGSGTPPGSSITSGSTSGSGNYIQTSNQQTCEASTESETVVQAPGSVASQSVAVLVNSRAIPKGLSLSQLRKGVAAASGIQARRGDVLSFSAAPFSNAVNRAATSSASPTSLLTTLLKPGAALVLVLAVLFMLRRTSRKARRQALASDLAYASLEGYEPYTLGIGAEPITAEIPAISAVSQLSNIQDMVDSQPEEVATVLRGWLQRTP